MPARKSQRGKGIKEIINYVRDNKLISKGLGLIPNPMAQRLSAIAGMAGLGKRKRKPQKQRGKGQLMPVGGGIIRQQGRGLFSDIGGGLGSLAGGIGYGAGSLAHGLFGSGKRRRAPRKSVISV